MKKLKLLLASLVFILIILVCSQVNAVTVTNAVELGTALNAGGGNVTIQGTTVTLNHDVNLTDYLYLYNERKRINIGFKWICN